MLKLVTGTSGSGKTEYVFKEIKKLVENGVKDILLITPEQFSFIAERRLLTDLGEQNVRFVDNSSFSRISDTVRREYGCGKLKVLSKGSKAVFMMRAVEASKDRLQLFNKRLDSLNFVNSMLSIYDEMKSCNLSSSEIYERSLSINNESLKKKLADISLIMNTYELMLKDRYSDNASELTVLYNRLTDIEFFKDKYVFLDGFNGFVAQEYKILELIVKESSCVTITLCTDSPESTDNYNLFGYVNNSAEILTKISKKAGVEVKNEYLSENFRAKNDEILQLEKYVLRENYAPCNTSDNVEIYCAKDITDECRQLARNVRKLLRNGYKAEEIAVISRDIDIYRDEISVTFKKYGIPFYNDERQPIKNQPLVVFIEYLLRCVNFSLRSDDILSLAKTGLTGVAREDINELENYVYLWNINGKKWTKPFENSTKGFVGKMTESDKKSLDNINGIREKLIEPILSFKNSVKGADCKEICAQIYYALINFGVDESVKQLAVNLSKLNKNALAEEQGRVWDLVMNILGELPESLGDDKVSLKEFAKIFSLVISTEDLGVIPSGIDNVQFGQADRIRTDNPRAVFILGANEGEFPKNITTSGLLSESDRKIMLENDFKLYSYSDILNLQERYFAYMACTCASEKVFVSYSQGSTNQNASSEIVESI